MSYSAVAACALSVSLSGDHKIVNFFITCAAHLCLEIASFESRILLAVARKRVDNHLLGDRSGFTVQYQGAER